MVVIALKCMIFLIMVDLVLTKIGIFIEFSLFLYIFQYLNLFNRESDHISFESTYWLFVRQTNMNSMVILEAMVQPKWRTVGVLNPGLLN